MSFDFFYQVQVGFGGVEYDATDDLINLTIEQKMKEIDLLRLQLTDPYKVLGSAVREGMEVEVDLGTVEEHSIVFRGRIYKVDYDFQGDDIPTVTVTAHDKRMDMNLCNKNRAHSGFVDQIVGEVARPYFGHAVDIELDEKAELLWNGIRQDHQTDLGFLERLGQRYGCAVFVDVDGESELLCFKLMERLKREGAVRTLYQGRCGVPHGLIEFRATSDISKVRLPRKFMALDRRQGKIIQTKTGTAPPPEPGENQFQDEHFSKLAKRHPEKADALEALVNVAEKARSDLGKARGTVEPEVVPELADEPELNIRARAQAYPGAQGMQASGSTLGDHRIRVHRTVDIQDVGARFSGRWYLSEVRHILNDQGYLTEFECKR